PHNPGARHRARDGRVRGGVSRGTHAEPDRAGPEGRVPVGAQVLRVQLGEGYRQRRQKATRDQARREAGMAGACPPGRGGLGAFYPPRAIGTGSAQLGATEKGKEVMRIHSDVLTARDLYEAANAAESAEDGEVYLELSPHGSRKRRRAFEVGLEGDGTFNRRRRNPGAGERHGEDKGYAATWDAWGRFLAHVVESDPDTHA